MKTTIVVAAALMAAFTACGDPATADDLASGAVVHYEAGPTVTNIRAYAFAECRSLESLRADFATTIGRNALMGCTGLREVRLPSVTNVAYATTLNGCVRLENVYLPLVGVEAAKASGFPWQTTAKAVVFHLADGDYDRLGRRVD